MHTLPSSMRAEMLPAVPSTRPVRSMSLAAASTAFCASGTVLIGAQLSLRQDLRVDDVLRALARQEPLEVVGHHLGLPRLHVVGRATDVGREHDIVHGDERM